MNFDHISILLVAKSPLSERVAELLSDTPLANSAVQRAESIEHGMQILESSPIHVALFDLEMNAAADFRALTELHSVRTDVPIVVLTSDTSEESVVRILSRGAVDFVNKNNLNETILLRSVRYSLERGKLVRERIQLQKLVLETGRRERERVSQELHDVVGQELTGLNMLASSLARKLKNKELAEYDMAKSIVEGIQSLLKEIRNIINGLMPVPVDAEGLRTSLEKLCQLTEERTGIVCQLDCADEMPFDDNETATQMFRIAQESVNNAVKHAEAKRIVVRLERRTDAAVLQIMDDGKGFLPSQVKSPGFGLKIMNHRAELIGASLQIYSHPGSGTVVHCSLADHINVAGDRVSPSGD